MEKHVQLQIDFDDFHIVDGEIVETSAMLTATKPKPQITKCKHCIKIKSFKKDYLSYCSKCGKILSVKHKKGE